MGKGHSVVADVFFSEVEGNRFYKDIKMMGIQLQENTKKNPQHQQYQQRHYLMVIVMKELLM